MPLHGHHDTRRGRKGDYQIRNSGMAVIVALLVRCVWWRAGASGATICTSSLFTAHRNDIGYSQHSHISFGELVQMRSEITSLELSIPFNDEGNV
eukprot:5338313-Pleurochrysis_carterae.AAC.2